MQPNSREEDAYFAQFGIPSRLLWDQYGLNDRGVQGAIQQHTAAQQKSQLQNAQIQNYYSQIQDRERDREYQYRLQAFRERNAALTERMRAQTESRLAEAEWKKSQERKIFESGGMMYSADPTYNDVRPVMIPQPGAAPGAAPTMVHAGGKRDAAKDLNAKELADLADHSALINQMLKATALIRGESVQGLVADPDAVGWKGLVGNFFTQRIDPTGIDTRQELGNLASMVRKERSGGAIPAAEMKGLVPFIPEVTDTSEKAQRNMMGMLKNYYNILTTNYLALKENRNIPVAYRNRMEKQIANMRAYLDNTMTAQDALDPSGETNMLKALEDELARRMGNNPGGR